MVTVLVIKEILLEIGFIEEIETTRDNKITPAILVPANLRYQY